MTEDECTRVLRNEFGLERFRDGQREVIEALLAGRSALAVFPTGGGKSLCYQLPALLFDGLTLVVSPLIALMKDQVDTLQRREIPAARLDSTLSVDEVGQIYEDMESGKLKLLFVSPERLSNEKLRSRLADQSIDLMAVDEAHCISEWGHNFRPDYLKLAKLAQDLDVRRILALTATATPKVAADICRSFGINEEDKVQLSFYRPNLHLRVSPCMENEKRELLLARLREDPSAPTIIYGTRQETAESLAAFLKRNDLPARPYHAGLRAETRAECQEAFMSGETNIITATIAFGMGIDKADIRRVIHYNLPKSLENFTQEIGRAGRDGRVANCELFACGDDLRVLENFIFADTPSAEAIKRVLEQILNRNREFDLSHYELSGVHDIRPLVIHTLLTYLELEGYIEATTPFYASYRLKFLRDREDVLHGYDDERKRFLRALFSAGKEGRLWLTINLEEAQEALQEPRERIVKALQHLETHGDVALKPAGVRHGYRRLRDVQSLSSLTAEMQSMFQRRESQDLARLRQVTEFTQIAQCRYQLILAHFGETMEDPCGHCDICLGEGSETKLPASPKPDMTLEETETIQSLLREKNGPLRTPRQLARFLCGLSSPAATRARLQRHDAFALLEDHEFGDVLAYCESLLIP
ncbi:MAG: RecQ family ATP-dependent DNA helicase [Verrucomicrobiota bacterium]